MDVHSLYRRLLGAEIRLKKGIGLSNDTILKGRLWLGELSQEEGAIMREMLQEREECPIRSFVDGVYSSAVDLKLRY